MKNYNLKTKLARVATRLFVAFTVLFLSMLGLAACGNEPGASQGQAATAPATVAVATAALSTPAAASSFPATPTTAPKPSVKPVTTLASAATTNPAPAGAPDNSEPILLRFSEFYAPGASAINLQFSDKLKAANGKRIKLTGYMAPPLKPDLDFFVLTRIRLAVCPFCSTAADWPEDIMLATMPDNKTVKVIEEPVTVVGKLEIGEAVDPKTGFFSLLRLRVENLEVFKGS